MAPPALPHFSLEQWLCREQKSIRPNWGTKSFQKRLSWEARHDSKRHDHAPDRLLLGQEHYLKKKKKIHSRCLVTSASSWLGSTGRSLTWGWANLLHHTPLLPSEGDIWPRPALIMRALLQQRPTAKSPCTQMAAVITDGPIKAFWQLVAKSVQLFRGNYVPPVRIRKNIYTKSGLLPYFTMPSSWMRTSHKVIEFSSWKGL